MPRFKTAREPKSPLDSHKCLGNLELENERRETVLKMCHIQTLKSFNSHWQSNVNNLCSVTSSVSSGILDSASSLAMGTSLFEPSESSLVVSSLESCLIKRLFMNELQILDIGGKADADVSKS